MKMTMRKMLAILATLAILCTVLPLGTLFSAIADDANLIAGGDFADGIGKWYASKGSTIEVVDGALHGDYNEDWGFIGYDITLEPNTDYVLTFDAKSINNGSVSAKLNKTDWTGTVQSFPCDFGAEWTTYTWEFNSGSYGPMWLYFQSGCEASANQEIWLDNVSLVKAAGGDAPVTPDEPDAPADGNLIVNGDFETGDIAPWDNLWGSCTVSIVEGREGGYALQWACGMYQMTRQKVALEKNTDYVLTAWAKDANALTFLVKDGGDSQNIAQASSSAGSEWKQYTLKFNSGDYDSAYISLMGNANGATAVIDDVVLTKVGGETPDEPSEPSTNGLVVNGDFETGDNTGWETHQSTVINGDAAKTGSYGANLIGDGGWGGLMNQDIKVENGATYVITLWVCPNAGGVNLQIKGANKVDDQSDNTWMNSGELNGWTERTVVVETTSETLTLNFCGGGNNIPADVYVDDISVVKQGGETPDEPSEPSTNDLVVNGDFETGDNTGWETHQSTVINGDAAKTGSYGANLIGDGGWGGLMNQDIKVENGATYVITLWVCPNAGGVNLQIKGANKVDDQSDNTWMNSGELNGWTERTVVVETTSETLTLNFCGGGNNIPADVYVDDISVVKQGGETPDEPVEPDEPVTPPSAGLLNATFDTDEFDGVQSTCDISVADGELQFNVNKDYGNIYAELGVEPNTDYEITFCAKSKLGKNVWVKFHKTDWTGDIGEKTIALSTSMKEYKTTLNSGDNSSLWLLIQYTGTADGEIIWFDYINVKKIGGGSQPGTSDALVKNGDFETGDNTGWEFWQQTVVNTDAAKNGQYGANLIGDGGWGGLMNQDVKVEAGETYIITLWVCPNTGGVNLQIKGATKIDEESDNTWMTVGELNGWTERKVTVVADSETLTLNFCGGGNNIAADIYIDDIVVTKKGAAPVVDETYPIKNAGFEIRDLGAWNNLWNACTYSFEDKGYNGSKVALNFAAEGQWQQIRQNNIPVEPNTDYVVVGYVKNPLNVNIVVKKGDDSDNINEIAIENDFNNKWVRAAVEFNSGDQTEICVLLISREAGASAIWDDVQVYVKGTEPTDVINDEEVTEGPIQLDSFGTSINRPASEDANLIENGSFENTEGGQWQSVISDTLYVVDDETAPEGNKSLFFNTSGVTENNKVIFYVEVEPDTDYVFSAWVKGAFISDDNRFNATFGVTDWKDNFCIYQDAVFSNKTRQIVPTAWDNEWHLRSVQFNSGVNTKVGIGFAGAESQMWIDGIALYTVDEGIKYADSREVSNITASSVEEDEAGTCADDKNLIVGATMDSAEAQDFWAGADGYKNGFLTFAENEYEYGTSLKYVGSDKSCYTNAIKWLELEPNTDYYFTVDIRVVESGAGSLNLLDGKKRECDDFLVIDFDQYFMGTDWFNVSIKFNTGEFDRIGIAIVDGSGEALIDNMRLFKVADRIDGGDDKYVEPPYSFDDPEDPDSPDTGISVMGAALAIALVPSTAAVAFVLRRKKEDEE